MADPTQAPTDLARTLRNRREAAQWSRETLSRQSGVSYATICRIELKGHGPSLRVLESLARALEIPTAELLEVLP